jgi:hypothetical protein
MLQLLPIGLLLELFMQQDIHRKMVSLDLKVYQEAIEPSQQDSPKTQNFKGMKT